MRLAKEPAFAELNPRKRPYELGARSGNRQQPTTKTAGTEDLLSVAGLNLFREGLDQPARDLKNWSRAVSPKIYRKASEETGPTKGACIARQNESIKPQMRHYQDNIKIAPNREKRLSFHDESESNSSHSRSDSSESSSDHSGDHDGCSSLYDNESEEGIFRIFNSADHDSEEEEPFEEHKDQEEEPGTFENHSKNSTLVEDENQTNPANLDAEALSKKITFYSNLLLQQEKSDQTYQVFSSPMVKEVDIDCSQTELSQSDQKKFFEFAASYMSEKGIKPLRTPTKIIGKRQRPESVKDSWQSFLTNEQPEDKPIKRRAIVPESASQSPSQREETTETTGFSWNFTFKPTAISGDPKLQKTSSLETPLRRREAKASPAGLIQSPEPAKLQTSLRNSTLSEPLFEIKKPSSRRNTPRKESPSKISRKVNIAKYQEKADQLAAKYEAPKPRVSSSKRDNSADIVFKFSCKLGHVFYKTMVELDNTSYGFRKSSNTTVASSDEEKSVDMRREWCTKCEDFYCVLTRLARKSGAKVVGKLYSDSLGLNCAANKHVTLMNPLKRLADCFKCAPCRKDERDETKRRLLEEDQKIQARLAAEQEKMFQKAREDMEKEMQSGGTFGSEDCFQPMETDYAAVERQVDVQAAQLTKAYLAKLSSSGSVPTDSVRTQVHLVYKFLNTPEELLQQGMGRLAPKQLSQFYKQLAKQLHPDKNAHPQAKEAFQRVQAAIECVKARHQRV